MKHRIRMGLMALICGLPLLAFAASPLTPVFQINAASADADDPDVSAVPGGFIAVWQRRGGADGGELRAYDAAGVVLGAARPIAMSPIAGGNYRIAADALGRYVIVRTYIDGSGSERVQHIQGRRFSASGAPLGDSFEVATLRTMPTPPIAVDMNAAGEFLIAWSDPLSLQVGDPLVTPALRLHSNVVRARRYDANGQPQGADFIVSAELADPYLWLGGTLVGTPPPVELDTDVALNDAGTGFVVWKNSRISRGAGTIYLRTIGAEGKPSGIKRQVSPLAHVTPQFARVAVDGSGNPTVVWASKGQIFARRHDAGGAPLGAAMRIDTAAGEADVPALAAQADGRLAVVWREGMQAANAIVAREFAADATPLGTGFAVSVPAASSVVNEPQLAIGAGGRMMLVWAKRTGPFPYFERTVHGRVYAGH